MSRMGIVVGLGLTSLLLSSCFLPVPEPNLLIKGMVQDAESGKPIEGAEITEDQYGKEPFRKVVTDAEGKYSFLTWYEEHWILAKATGYKIQRQLLRTKFIGMEKEKMVSFSLISE